MTAQEQNWMQFHFTAMTLDHARCILAWKYNGPYAFYNYAKSADHILNTDLWGRTLFAALDATGQLVGELTLGFLDPDFEWVSQADIDAGRLEGCILWIGFGMRPDLTGQGHGLPFVNACADFAVQFTRERYHYTGEYIGLGVYQFNQRAIKVYERAGFVKFMERCPIIDGQPYPAQRMKKRI
jgi:ribosomal-protein-alanine N-acetyltransferase